MKQYMLVMYNNVTETADEAMNNIACEIYKTQKNKGEYRLSGSKIGSKPNPDGIPAP